MRIQKLKVLGSTLVLAAAIGTFSAFAHEEGGEGKGMGMMSGDMGHMGGMMEMMNMMSEMSPEERQSMMQACMKMMQSQTGADAETGADAKE